VVQPEFLVPLSIQSTYVTQTFLVADSLTWIELEPKAHGRVARKPYASRQYPEKSGYVTLISRTYLRDFYRLLLRPNDPR
jgi:hypothetical protein